jgi:uncharacterized protein
MNILLINDDYWHHGDVSDAGVQPLGQKGFRFDTLKDGAEFGGKKLEEYAVVMFVKSDNRTADDQAKWMTEENRKKLTGYVDAGGGLLVAHSGTCYGGMEDLHGLIGGLFITHPKQLPVTFQPKAGHPLAAGAEAFTLMEEHYFMDMADEPVDVFLTSTSRHATLPAGWTRTQGRGRVCVLTPGHGAETWLNPNFQKLLENTLLWCAGK